MANSVAFHLKCSSLFPFINHPLQTFWIITDPHRHCGQSLLVCVVQLSPDRAAFFAGVEEAFLTTFLSKASIAVHSSSVKQRRIYYTVSGSLQIFGGSQRTRLGCHTAEVSSQEECSIMPRTVPAESPPLLPPVTQHSCTHHLSSR